MCWRGAAGTTSSRLSADKQATGTASGRHEPAQGSRHSKHQAMRCLDEDVFLKKREGYIAVPAYKGS
eukprot:1143259-Pelagomonas_calceolata.AAC.2